MPILAAIFPGLPGRALSPVTTMTKMMSHRTLSRLPKGKDASSNYLSNTASISPLDTLRIAAWSRVNEK
ncbi:hypothetical protein K443DRAFT_9977 [Laccaria amethystina LaAM-08-1]|uniref:Uncharacterized protein n=1 Tax=Laccaria amethystina LaAM-08-1 TaxID=1095629 RepID=A0A0C9WX84_9AGAR|nr:hypothetical protein K443DRAFT_9977 [Laccaria amethystina LaAM-08-1]